jgi:hypothetical protein
VLSGVSALQVGEDFHVPIKAGGTACEVLADRRIGPAGVLSQPYQFAIGWTVDPLRVWKRLRKIRLCEAEEFFLVNFLSLFVAHWLALPTLTRQALGRLSLHSNGQFPSSNLESFPRLLQRMAESCLGRVS